MDTLEQTPLEEPQTNVEETKDKEPLAQEEPSQVAAEAEAVEPAEVEEAPQEQAPEVAPADEPVAEEPVAEEPVAEEPAAEEPVAEEPKTEEPSAEVAEEEAAPVPEEKAEEQQQPEEAVEEGSPVPLMMTKQEVMARVNAIVETGETSDKQELDLLKQLYYKYHNTEAMEARQAYIDAGGDPNDYVPKPDPTEEQFKLAMQTIRQRRADMQVTLEKERQDNLARKLAVIEKIKELATTPEEANKSYERFKALQNEWKETGAVPAENVTELWKNYHLYVEQFYDMLKLNSEMREYDFRKNLEAKITLCEQAEKLKDEPDVITAINRLQTLHQEWKEIGPIAKDLREEIWNRFKEASTVIRKRHQEFFEQRKAREQENLEKKTALCEKAEAIDITALTSFAQWEARTKEIIALQAEWKTIGYAPHKSNNQIFERFRKACDQFFSAKSAFYKTVKSSLSENLEKKTALAEQAEALKDSTDWKKTTEQLVELQKQWKAIGAVPRKVSEQLWKRFSAACDQFFSAKAKAHQEQRTEQRTNLEQKRSVIGQLKALAEEGAECTVQQVRSLQDEWGKIGHVPLRDKDKLYQQYHELLDTLYGKLNLSQAQRRLSSFRTSLKVTAEKAGGTLARERERLMRTYEMMNNEIQTYENNLGFLSTASKGGNALMQEVTKKVERLKGELAQIGQRIKAINEEIRKGNAPAKPAEETKEPAEEPTEPAEE
ncbi:MAG: DUF349 domain-containing protein [Prevotellaceae bacterium]|nr:DUF349 domain-containing protein [Prevotellaceae bacterium]